MPKKPSLPPFAARLKALRERAGLTVYALAKRTGLNEASLYRLAAGRDPTWDTVQKLSDALGISTEEFRG
jgi:transcriptional regulator with XRE-family HTH domain